MSAYWLTEDDRALIQELLEERARRPRSTPTGSSQFIEDGSDSPDVYLVRTPASGIPGLQLDIGFGTADVPGEADCDCYQVIRDNFGSPVLESVESLQFPVFNLSPVAVPGSQWATIVRDKFGSWIVTPPTLSAGGSETVLMARLLFTGSTSAIIAFNVNIPVVSVPVAGEIHYYFGVDFGDKDHYTISFNSGTPDNWYEDVPQRTSVSCVMKSLSGTSPERACDITIHGVPVDPTILPGTGTGTGTALVGTDPCGPCFETSTEYCVFIDGITNAAGCTGCSVLATEFRVIRRRDGVFPCSWLSDVITCPSVSGSPPSENGELRFALWYNPGFGGYWAVGFVRETPFLQFAENFGLGFATVWDCNEGLVIPVDRPDGHGFCTITAPNILVYPCGSTPPTGSPSITVTATAICQTAGTFTIAGTGFSTTPSDNVVLLDLGATALVTSATSTLLTCTFTTQPSSLGTLRAVVNTPAGSSGAPRQIATVISCVPTVTYNDTDLCQDATTVAITGTYFSTTPSNNTVTLNLGASGTVTAATSTTLTVTFSVNPTSLGALTAIVATPTGTSTPAVQIATVIDCGATPPLDCITVATVSSSSQYVVSALPWSGTPLLTISLWVKRDASSGNSGILQWASTGTPNDPNPAVLLADDPYGTGFTYWYVNGSYQPTPFGVTNGVWTHLALTWSGTIWKAYKDGTLVDTWTDGFTETNAVDFYVGTGYAGYWTGWLSDVRVWISELSGSDITAIYNGGCPTNDSTLGITNFRLRWRLDDGTGVIATDSSGNATDGTLTNGPTWEADCPCP